MTGFVPENDSNDKKNDNLLVKYFIVKHTRNLAAPCSLSWKKSQTPLPGFYLFGVNYLGIIGVPISID